MKIFNLIKSFSLFNLKNDITSMNIQSCINNISIRNTYKATNLWNSVLSVSTQGAKKGRGKGRAAGNIRKNLNYGQEMGTGKFKVEWPGLNVPLLKDRQISGIKILGEDKDRELRLQELRSKMDKFRRLSIPPNERGWSGGTLNGKSIGIPSDDPEVNLTGFDTKILQYRVVATVTSILGKKRSPDCFVVTGNKNGVIGFGSGKATLSGAAIRLAKNDSAKRLLKIDLFENRTLFHNFYQEFYYTKIYAERKPAGFGLRCHRVIKTICELVGIKDIYVKVTGSMNTRNMAKAFVTGLLNQNKYSEIANKKGLHVVEMRPEMNYYPMVLASPTTTEVRHKEDLKHEFEKDINLYALDNKYRMKKRKNRPFYHDYPLYKRYLITRDRGNVQYKTKIERLNSLSDNNIFSVIYPRKPAPKESSEEATA